MPENKLHFTRVRNKETTSFVDSSADIKNLVPACIRAVLTHLYAAQETEQKKADKNTALLLDNYMAVFTTRLLEDPTPLIKQLNELGVALSKLDQTYVTEFLTLLGQSVLAAYAMFMRRDGALDGTEKHRIAGSLTALVSVFNNWGVQHMDILKTIVATVKESVLKDVTDSKPSAVCDVDALCDDGTKYTDLKQTVLITVGANPATTDWQTAAELCDRYFTSAKGTVNSNIAAALAYPSFDSPYFDVTIGADNDGNTEKDTQTVTEK